MKTLIQRIGVKVLVLSLLFSFSCATPYQKALQEAEKVYEEQEQQGWDIILDPIEQVPDSSELSAQNSSIGSWSPVYMGSNDRVLLDTLKARVFREEVTKVHVYIIDTAPDGRHPALKAITGTSRVFVTGDDGKDGDSNGHGTHCGGIIAGVYPGRTIPIGVAAPLRDYNLIELHFGQALSDSGSGSFSWVGNAIDWAISDSKEERARGEKAIISMSLGGNTSTTMLDPHMKRAEDAGFIVVAANGNTGRSPLNYPGKSIYAQGVASLAKGSSSVTRSSFSSYGPETQFAAPGSAVYGPYKTNKWATLSGTSMATPAVAGALAYIWALNPNVTNKQMLTAFRAKAFDLGVKGHDPYYGYGAPILTRFLKPIGGETPPEDPDEPGDDPDDNPEPPTPDPDPEPEPSPELPELPKAQTIYHKSVPHSIRIQWRNRGEGVPDTSFNFKFSIQSEYTSKSKTPEQDIEKLLGNYFNGRRGIVLPGNGKSPMDTKRHAAYYTVVFLELELVQNKKLKFDVIRIDETPTGTFLEERNLPRTRENQAQYKVASIVDGVTLIEWDE